MIYLTISNRPLFSRFAHTQFKKCSGCNFVVLGNGRKCDYLKMQDGLEYFFDPKWKHAADAFNWFRDNYQKNDDLFLMDDDISLLGDTVSEFGNWISRGWDRVLYTKAYLFDVESLDCQIVKWHAMHMGSCMGISRDLWRQAPWPNRASEASMRYLSDLPEHNIKRIPLAKTVHLIHKSNDSLNRSIRQKFADPIPQGIVNEVTKYNLH